MIRKFREFRVALPPFVLAACVVCCAGAATAGAQTPAETPTPAKAPAAPKLLSREQKAAPTAGEAKPVDRASSYYHFGLAKLYESEAENNGRQDMATQAIEQYKLALDADPDSRELQDGIANLYFRLGRIKEAVSTARSTWAANPAQPAVASDRNRRRPVKRRDHWAVVT